MPCGRTPRPLSFPLLVIAMRTLVLPVPLIRLLLRVEIVPVARRPANDIRKDFIRHTLAEALRRELSPRILQDIGLDRSRQD